VAIQAEAVLEEHAIYLILEAASQEQGACSAGGRHAGRIGES
jgi:hypothetical protein